MTTARTAGPLPKPLRTAIVLLALQAAFNVLGGALLLMLASDEADHGGDSAGLLALFGWVSLVIALLLAVSAAATPRGAAWVRTTVIAVEVLAVLGSAVSLFSGAFTAVAGIAIAVFIIRAYASADAKRWFG
ncbi:hypothetical protein [Kitasatospora sp. NPDC059571]|uniref:DUF7144 family membrane protein n=1 Tax=Kitasatospora sp. NPDC059571 TaxID=3346871 RepID=UPI00369881E2